MCRRLNVLKACMFMPSTKLACRKKKRQFTIHSFPSAIVGVCWALGLSALLHPGYMRPQVVEPRLVVISPCCANRTRFALPSWPWPAWGRHVLRRTTQGPVPAGIHMLQARRRQTRRAGRHGMGLKTRKVRLRR